MKCSHQYDQDPRYGWASVDLEGETTALLIIHTDKGSLGFNFSERDQSMTPTCICYAYSQPECSCPHLEPDYWEGAPE